MKTQRANPQFKHNRIRTYTQRIMRERSPELYEEARREAILLWNEEYPGDPYDPRPGPKGPRTGPRLTRRFNVYLHPYERRIVRALARDPRAISVLHEAVRAGELPHPGGPDVEDGLRHALSRILRAVD